MRRARGRSLPSPFESFVVPGAGWQAITRQPLGWRRGTARRHEWQAMRSQWDQFGWRERWVFPRNALEWRAPFYDLRVIELLASTPDWVKRHNGRTKDVLRAAEYRVLPP